MKNYTCFQSSIDGLKSAEDWDVYVDLSNAFKIPLVDAASGTVETCVFTNELGEESVKVAWNMINNSMDIAAEIILNTVDDAVDFSSLNDATVSNEEVMKIHENILKDIEKKIVEMNDPLANMIVSRAAFIDLMDIGAREDGSGVSGSLIETEVDRQSTIAGQEVPMHRAAEAETTIGNTGIECETVNKRDWKVVMFDLNGLGCS